MISKPVVALIAVIAFALGAVVGVFGYLAVTAGSGEASQDVQTLAPTLALVPAEDASDADEPADAGDATDADEPADADEPTATEEAQTAPVEVTSALYRIDQTVSEVSFGIYEELNGVPITVIGTTNDIAGDVVVNFVEPPASQVGEIVINARTLRTDNEFRNQALRSRILRSADNAYEFIRFVPTDIIDFDYGDVGEDGSITFRLIGDLTIIETTRPVTFDVTVNVNDDDTLSISGTAVVLYRDFNLTIPSVPSVANVGEEVTLTIEAIATLIESL